MRTGYLSLMAGCALMVLSGCGLTHAIDHHAAPARPAPPAYSQTAAATALSAGWYESFNDPQLSALIDRALENNLDIVQSFARLQQAEAVARQSGAGALPTLDVTGSSQKNWQDGNEREGYSNGGVTLSWEIDIFNRLGAAATADRLKREAAAADLDAVRLMLTASLATSYYNAVAQHMQIELLRAQLATDNKFLDLVRQRHRQGLGTRLDVLQQESQSADTASLIPPAEASLRAHENRLDVLLGEAPDSFNRTAATNNFPAVGALPPIGVPADLLLNRPDLRALQRELVAADAAIGVAISDLLPRIMLTGSFMMADGPSITGPVAALLGNLVQPLLDWGRRRAEVERNKALYDEKLAAFTQAYLVAVEEVENALYREDRQRIFIQRLEERHRILADTVRTAEQIFREGLSDYLPVLDAIGALRTVERNLLQERRNLVLHRIELFRAIGAPLSSPPEKDHEKDE